MSGSHDYDDDDDFHSGCRNVVHCQSKHRTSLRSDMTPAFKAFPIFSCYFLCNKISQEVMFPKDQIIIVIFVTLEL